MKTLEITEAPAPLLDYVRSLGEEPVALTVGKKPIAVLLPVQNADLETVSLSLNPKFLAFIERSKRRYYQEGGISSEELRRELGIPPYAERKKSTDHNAKPKANRRRRKVKN
jgi:hypothetical protein